MRVRSLLAMIKCRIEFPLVCCVLSTVPLQVGCQRPKTKVEIKAMPAEKPLAVLDLARMKQSGAFAALPVRVVEVVDDPAFQAGRKQFRGYSLSEVLAQTKLSPGTDAPPRIHLIARDGYQTELAFTAKDIEGAVLAYEDVEAPSNEQWHSFRSGKRWMTPAPFYLVWPTAQGKPWPYQLERIEVWSSTSKDAAYPVHAPEAKAGYQIFREQCMSCHSINLAGGSLGPELNVPKNVVEYRDQDVLRAFIRNAGAFHARSVMPAFEHLSRKELDAIVYYLGTMAGRKVCSCLATCQTLDEAKAR